MLCLIEASAFNGLSICFSFDKAKTSELKQKWFDEGLMFIQKVATKRELPTEYIYWIYRMYLYMFGMGNVRAIFFFIFIFISHL